MVRSERGMMSDTRPARRGRLLAIALLAAFVLGACGGAKATPTPAVTPAPAASPSAVPSLEPTATSAGGNVPPSAAPSTAASSPAGSGAPGASPSASAGLPDFGNPDRTLPPGMRTWPTSVIDATIALAAADNEFRKAQADLSQAAQTNDSVLMLSALDGTADLAAQALPNAQKLTTWVDTQTVGQQLVVSYTAFQQSALAAATALRGNDNAAFASAIGELKTAIEDYGAARSGLVNLTDLALIMRKGLLLK